MLDSLLEIETTYSMMNRSNKADPMYSNYEKLKTDLIPLDKQSAEYEMILRYVKNTQAHHQLEILEIFSVSRQGEKQRYRPFKNIHNRMLLWHGSRITNFASILTKGLINPRAQRGIYFADMIGKSVDYCQPCQTNDTYLILLSEVALGKIKHNASGRQLPNTYNSVKLGSENVPNPAGFYVREDGVSVPYSKPGVNYNADSFMNEYIIYDPAQINIQYLLKFKVNMQHNYGTGLNALGIGLGLGYLLRG